MAEPTRKRSNAEIIRTVIARQIAGMSGSLGNATNEIVNRRSNTDRAVREAQRKRKN